MGWTARRLAVSPIDLLLLLVIVAYVILWLSGGGIAVVSGRSMEPTLHTGDIVVYLGQNPDGIREGDVVIYSNERTGNLVIHRVVFRYEADSRICFVIQGDNNLIPDTGDPALCPPVSIEGHPMVFGIPQEWIKGEVVAVRGYVLKIPYVGVIALVVRGVIG